VKKIDSEERLVRDPNISFSFWANNEIRTLYLPARPRFGRGG